LLIIRLFLLQMFYMAIVLYAPSLALNAGKCMRVFLMLYQLYMYAISLLHYMVIDVTSSLSLN